MYSIIYKNLLLAPEININILNIPNYPNIHIQPKQVIIVCCSQNPKSKCLVVQLLYGCVVLPVIGQLNFLRQDDMDRMLLVIGP